MFGRPKSPQVVKLAVWMVAGALALGATPARALGKSHVKASLLAESDWILPGKPFTVGLRLEMESGWHTYWKNPGDAGLPPKVSWRLPDGFLAGPIQWPTPMRISAPPLMSYGYEGEVLLPMVLTTPGSLASGSQIVLAGRADWVECKEVCIPGRAEVELAVPVKAEPPPPPGPGSPFAAARRLQPVAPEGWGVEAAAADGKILLSFRLPAGGVVSDAYFFASDASIVDHPAPQRLHSGAKLHRLDIARAAGHSEPLARLEGILSADGKSVVVDVPVTPLAAVPPPPSPPAATSTGLPAALALAFVGGLILNLMPCVLPVLSLKVLGFLKQAGVHPRHARVHGLVFAAGVVLSFWALAGILLALRALGRHVGWGFQLQSPGFVVFLAFLFFLLALNLFGVFEMGAALTSAGNVAAGRSGLGHSFWNGALATIVATPCTAPFMGSALGYGLSQPAAVSLLIFTALGLGMAAPYVALSWSPRLLRFLPRPGPWMEGFKQLMGFCLMATVIALLWLFGQQAGVDGIAVLLGALLLAGLGAWVYGRPSVSVRGRALRVSVSAALVVAALAIGFGPARAASAARASAPVPDSRWQPWSEARVAELRGQGRPVFVDFTAAWCLTCQVNARVALDTPEVAERFEREGVTLLKADWTLRDDRITQALAAHGRQGVPVYVLYGRDPKGEPHLLPEILTPTIVLEALDEVLGSKTAAVR
jgi:thiol:disulfide interchange protein/DsbC/DsbD-like thiol-disulfide interchange protein